MYCRTSSAHHPTSKDTISICSWPYLDALALAAVTIRKLQAMGLQALPLQAAVAKPNQGQQQRSDDEVEEEVQEELPYIGDYT